MEADGQPSDWLASQINQRAASRSPESALKTASNTSASMTSERKRCGWMTASWPPSRRAAVDTRSVSSWAEETVIGPMLAKRGDEGECQQERNRRANDGRQHVPLAGCSRIPKAPPPHPANPGQDGAEPDHAEQRAHSDDRRRHRPQGALAEGERPTRRAGGAQIGEDQESGAREDHQRPGDVQQEQSRNGLPSVSARRDALAGLERSRAGFGQDGLAPDHAPELEEEIDQRNEPEAGHERAEGERLERERILL